MNYEHENLKASELCSQNPSNKLPMRELTNLEYYLKVKLSWEGYM